MTSAVASLYLQFVQPFDISNLPSKKRKNLGNMCLDCLQSILVTFKAPPSLITHLLSSLSNQSVWNIRHLQRTRFWMFGNKRCCNRLGVIKGIAIWSRGSTRGTLWRLQTGNRAWKASGTQGKLEGNLLRYVRARALLRVLMTQKSCGVGMRNAILKNQFNRSSFLNLKIYSSTAMDVRSFNWCSIGYDDHNETSAPIKIQLLATD